MTTPAFEAFLARLYTGDALRDRFLADPEGEARAAGLNDAEVTALASVDREGLIMASRSFAAKRRNRRPPRVHLSWIERLFNGIGRLISRLQ